MLDYVSTSWYQYSLRPGYFPVQGVGCFLYDNRVIGVRSPFKMGFKPIASEPNLLGNTDTDHYQLHGTCWDTSDKFKQIQDLYPNQHKDLYRCGFCNKELTYQYQVKRKGSGLIYTQTALYPLFEGCSLQSGSFGEYLGTDQYQYHAIAIWGDSRLGGISTQILYDRWTPNQFELYIHGCSFRVARGNTVWPVAYRLILKDDITIQDTPFGSITLKADGYNPVYRSGKITTPELPSRAMIEGITMMFFERVQHTLRYSGELISQKIPLDSFVIQEDPSLARSTQSLFALKRVLIDDARSREPQYDLNLLLGDATQSAADAMLKFTGNTLPLIKELIELKSTILDIYKLLQGEVSVKNLSNLWLSARYGLKLTFQDARDLIEAILAERNRVKRYYSYSRGVASAENVEARSKLYVDNVTPNQLERVLRFLYEWDLFPSLVNAWDLVPYSFVADWFVDIESFLSAIDTHTYLSILDVISVCYTTKVTWSIPSAVWHGLHGNYWFTHFVRYNPSIPVQPTPTFSGSLPSGKNIIDGAALIIQRT